MSGNIDIWTEESHSLTKENSLSAAIGAKTAPGHDFTDTGVFFKSSHEDWSQRQFGNSFQEVPSQAKFEDKTFRPDTELADLEVSHEGVFQSNWKQVENIPSQIIEVTPKVVIMECLVSTEPREYEERAFQRELLEDAVPLRHGQLVYVQFRMRPGEARYKFVPGNGLFSPDLFEVPNAFEGLEDVGFDQLLD